MSRGRVKTILLTLLVVCSFLFAAQNWFGEGLWPQGQTPLFGAGFFSFMENMLNGNEGDTALSAYSALTDPEWIVANRQGSQKELYYTSDPAFAELNGLGDELLSYLFAESGIQSAAPIEGGEEEYRAMLRTQSLCLYYRTPIPVSLLGQILSLPEASLENIGVVQELLFLPSKSSPNNCTLAVVDAKNGNAMTFDFTFDPERLRSAIGRNTREDSYLTYAFEINLGQEDSAVPLSPMTAISMEPVTAPVLAALPLSVPIADRVLPLFGYNPSTPKRFTEADDSQVFLDRKSQLRITADGVVEFTVDAGARGLSLTESAESHAILQALLNLAESIDHAAFDGLNEAQLYITSDLTDLSTVTMDYVCSGRPVRLPDGPAVTAQFDAGQLVAYRQQVRQYQITAETTTSPDVLSAIDALLETTAPDAVTTPLDLRLLYRDKKDGATVTAAWEVW